MILLIIVVAFALIFDVINGFHDAANSIATIVSTNVLTPFQAAIIDIGAVKRLSAVRWGLTRNIIFAWIITIPITSLLAAAIYFLSSLIF